METYKTTDTSSYILGISLTIEALKNVPQYMERVIISSKCYKNEQFNTLNQLCKSLSIEIIEDDKLMDKLSVKENCYGIGIFKKFYRNINGDKHVCLYKFNDYGELGTIFRSAVSFDFKDIVLIGCDIDYFDPRCVRASMGAIFHLNIKSYPDIETYLNEFKYNLYPFIPSSKTELKNLKLKKPYALIIPNQYHGLEDKFDDGFYIKHKNDEELPLSSTSSILFSYCFSQNANDKNI